jgi:D-arabinono-1,4-lactone oxidase
MSPCHGRACVALHMTWKPDDAVARLLPLIEEKLVPLGAVPHWGKLFTMAPAVVRSRYPRLADFRELVRHHDPDGKFRNEFLDRYIFGGWRGRRPHPRRSHDEESALTSKRDGRGIAWRNRMVAYRDQVLVDDDLVLWLTRTLPE